MSDGQHIAVTALIEEHYEFLYRFAYRLSGSSADAEDLTQQTFLQAQQKFDQLRSPELARGWLITILKNFFRRSFRTQRPAPFSSFTDEIDPEAPLEPEQPIDSEDLQTALNEIPPEFREPLTLFYLNDLSYNQIAEMLEIPPGTVMSRLARGKDYLRRRLTRLLATPPNGRTSNLPHSDGIE
ncbi:MAG: RNA polymerase sigma factor [Planctomycetaceae bacterium]